MTSEISIHNLAVLRASIEGVHLGTYFGSWGALKSWIESTKVLGLIDSEGMPTDKGANLAQTLDLLNQGEQRAYLWKSATMLEAKARTSMQNRPTE